VPSDEWPKFISAAYGEVWSFIRNAGLPRPGNPYPNPSFSASASIKRTYLLVRLRAFLIQAISAILEGLVITAGFGK
jgi:hypothetical protein